MSTHTIPLEHRSLIRHQALSEKWGAEERNSLLLGSLRQDDLHCQRIYHLLIKHVVHKPHLQCILITWGPASTGNDVSRERWRRGNDKTWTLPSYTKGKMLSRVHRRQLAGWELEVTQQAFWLFSNCHRKIEQLKAMLKSPDTYSTASSSAHRAYLQTLTWASSQDSQTFAQYYVLCTGQPQGLSGRGWNSYCGEDWMKGALSMLTFQRDCFRITHTRQ